LRNPILSIRRSAPAVLAFTSLFATATAVAADVCLAPVPRPVVPAAIATDATDTVRIRAGDVAGQGRDGSVDLSAGVSLSYRGGVITSERATFSDDSSTIEVIENVSLEGDGFIVFAEGGTFYPTSETASFSRAGFNLTDQAARATADSIVVDPEGLVSLTEIMFTTCPEDDLDWQLLGRNLEIDPAAGFARARGVRLKFKAVPILWTPVFSFPIDDRRKSGFLTPQIAERDRTGFDLTVPYYLNLAPNFDLLLEPRLMEDRGFQFTSRFRYLLPNTEGQLDIESLPDDNQVKRSRHFVKLAHESMFGDRWQLETSIEDVSDSAYFEDLGESLGVISQTHLTRTVDLAYFGDRWSIVSRVNEYQTIDDFIADADRPYRRKPQMVFDGSWGDRLIGFESTAEAVDFDRTVGETGWRLHSNQEVSLRFRRPGMYLTPAVGFMQTNYRIDSPLAGFDRSPSRGLPMASVDSGLLFERIAGRDQSWIQTIEPRLLYVNVPYEDQSNLPVFDTILPDFNLVQLFSKYQFVGGDRVADTNQVSVGLTSRLIESTSGRERVSVTIGQTRYRDPRRVMLPNETATDSTRSNYVAELYLGLSQKWNLDVGYQWNGVSEETVRAETRFEYRPADDRFFGVGYRMRRNVLEQGDLSLVWPVTDRWRLIGQYSYSLLEEEPLERLAGIEYDACCWRLRLTSRRYIVRSTGATDDTISIQLELKGLARGGATPEELLGRGILGFRRFDAVANSEQ
jgi:LPS-assembly protein